MEKIKKIKNGESRFIGKRLKYGAISTAVTAIFITLIVLLNIVTSMLSTRFSLKADITPQKYFEVSDETKEYLEQVDTEVEIVMLADEMALSVGTYNKYLLEILYKYTKYSDKVTLKFIDPETNPDYVKRYEKIYSGTIAAGSIVVTSGERIRVLTQSDIVSSTVDYNTYTESTSIIAEQSLTSAVAFVTNENPANVTVMASSLEDVGLSGIVELLEKNGYLFTLTDPVTGVIDESTDVLIISSPINDYTEAACQRVEDFLYNGGNYGKNLLYFPSYEQNDTPNLDALLATWGISVDEGFVCENDYNYYVNNAYNIIAPIGANDYSELLADSSRPFIMPLPCPLKKLWDANSSYTVTSLLSTSPAAYRVDYEMLEDESFSIETVEKEVFDLILLSTRTEMVNNNQALTNVLVVASPYAVDAPILTATSYANGEYMVAILNSLTGKEDNSITIVPKDIEKYSITLSAAAAERLKAIMVLGIPALLLIIGIVIWARRRNR